MRKSCWLSNTAATSSVLAIPQADGLQGGISQKHMILTQPCFQNPRAISAEALGNPSWSCSGLWGLPHVLWSFCLQLFATKILGRADSQHSWRLLISVLPQLWARFAFMVVIVRSEDPDPEQLQHRETHRASPELHERFPVQIKPKQWLYGLQILLDHEQEDALQKGTGQEYGNLDATWQVLVLKQKNAVEKGSLSWVLCSLSSWVTLSL